MNLLSNKEEWIKDFIHLGRHQKLLAKANEYVFEPIYKFDKKLIIDYNKIITPREDDIRCKIFDLQPFYILDHISQNSQDEIYDIGCGINFFKNFYNIIGIDPNSIYADVKEEFNSDFCLKNQNKFANIFSINAIHFCKIDDLHERINSYFNLTKDQGYSYLAINIARPIEITYNNILSNVEKEILVQEITENIKKTIYNLPGTLLLYEDLCKQCFDEGLNGNIRILTKR